nr:GNAT family N-acetyltransferase [uncultured Dyadobacter sp.]
MQSTFEPGAITLRTAQIHDLETLQSLYQQTIEDSCQSDYDERQRKAWRQGVENKQRWISALENQYFLIAEMNGQLAGFGSLRDDNYVDLMYTGKDFQRMGVARRIYEHLESKALASGTLVISADVSKTARRFFEKQGFILVSENLNVIGGVDIVNYSMQKILH